MGSKTNKDNPPFYYWKIGYWSKQSGGTATEDSSSEPGYELGVLFAYWWYKSKANVDEVTILNFVLTLHKDKISLCQPIFSSNACLGNGCKQSLHHS